MTFTASSIDAAVAEVTALTKSPGICLAIDGPGGTYLKAFGVTNINTMVPITPDSHFRCGSVTKLLTALAVLAQVERGTIQLTDRLDKYIPGIVYGSDITIKHLLNHTSGVCDYDNSTITYRMNYLSNWPGFGPDEPLNLIKQGAAKFIPGISTAYSNSGYWLLGRILEIVTMKPTGQVLTEEVIQPLGLSNTSYPIDSSIPEPTTHGYTQIWFMTFDSSALNPNYVGAAGAVISTVNDLVKLAKALCTGETLTPGVKALWDEVFVAPASTTLQWHGQTGNLCGYGTFCYWEPVTKTVFVGMENLALTPTSGLQQIFNRINRSLLS